jgi:hypothetical protein
MTTESNALSLARDSDLSKMFNIDVQRVIVQTTAIQQVMRSLMKPGVHYGVIPGTEKTDKDGNDISKPSLFQPGADKLCLLFRLRPEYETTITATDDFIGVTTTCRLVHIVTGENWGEGMGSANAREERYRRQALAKLCPQCKKATVFKSKDEGGGWFCWRKKDGCGRTFQGKEAAAIEGQTAQLNNDKIWDLHNTILKMANKRARVAAVLSATAASDIFTQDLEDLLDEGDEVADVAEGQPTSGGNGGKKAAPAKAEGKKKATPVQVRDLNMALNDAEIGMFDANKHGLQGRDREDFILVRRLEWCSGMLGREVKLMTELPGDEADRLIKAAKAGEVPAAAPASQPAGGKA